MGLMKLSGDLYNYEEDAKIAMGVESMDANQVAPNNLADEQPKQIDTQVQPIQATLKQPAPNVPAAPVAAPEQDIYMPNQKSLPPLPPNTRYASYEGSKMSRLKDLLNKVAMTQEDLDSGYSEIPSEELTEAELFPEIEGDGSVQNYTAPADYSNYMAAKAPVAQDSYDIGDYSELPADSQYLGGFTSDVDVDPGVYQMSEDSMGYSPYSQGGYETMGYSPYSQGGYESLGYDPYQAYSNYEQMYASPTSGGGEYQEMQAQEAEPQVDPAQEAYQQSYDEIYNYLIQMGYSPEEASASAPALLQQVNVSEPQTQQKQASYNEYYSQPRVMTKTASITFNSRANELKASFIEAGYSPYQAQEMSMEVVIPQAEKYASLAARAIGGGIGAVSGGLAAHSRYDEGEDTSALLAGALLGGGLGAFAGGRAPAYLGKNINKADVLKDLSAKQDLIFKKQLDAARGLGLLGKKQKPADYNALVRDVLKGQNLKKPTIADPNNITAAEQKALDVYNKQVKNLKTKLQAGEGDAYRANAEVIQNLRSTDKAVVEKALQPLRAEAGAAARASDAKKLLTGIATTALPGYYVDSALRRTSGDNLVDGGFDYASSGLDSLGNALSSGGSQVGDFVSENPGLTAALAASAAATPYAIDYVREQKSKAPKKKGGKTKKAQLENYLDTNSEKVAMNLKALGTAFQKLKGSPNALRTLGYTGAGALGGAGTATAGLTDEQIERMGGRGIAMAGGAFRGALLGGLGGRFGGHYGGAAATGLMTAPGAIAAAGSLADDAETPEWVGQLGRSLTGTQEGGWVSQLGEAYNNREQRAREERINSLKSQIQNAADAREKAKLEAKLEADFAKEEARLQGILSGGGSSTNQGIMDYITNNPGKSALIGAGTAAGLYGLYNLATSGSSGNSGSNVDRLRQYQQQQLLMRGRR